MNAPALTRPELLTIWEEGEGRRPSGRALALLAGAAPDVAAEEAAAMPVGLRDASLLDLRVALSGSAFTAVTSCPACAEEMDISFEADEVRREPPARAQFALQAGDYTIEVRLPATSDLAAIEGFDDCEAARARLFARCVVHASRGGEDVAASALPPKVAEAIVDAMAQADPQADAQLELTCPQCEQTWLEPFDVATFLWSELSAAARRLLSDIHQLARAYGWSERDILALHPARRNAYLEMLQ